MANTFIFVQEHSFRAFPAVTDFVTILFLPSERPPRSPFGGLDLTLPPGVCGFVHGCVLAVTPVWLVSCLSSNRMLYEGCAQMPIVFSTTAQGCQ